VVLQSVDGDDWDEKRRLKQRVLVNSERSGVVALTHAEGQGVFLFCLHSEITICFAWKGEMGYIDRIWILKGTTVRWPAVLFFSLFLHVHFSYYMVYIEGFVWILSEYELHYDTYINSLVLELL
jgi:hypothetical protein